MITTVLEQTHRCHSCVGGEKMGVEKNP